MISDSTHSASEPSGDFVAALEASLGTLPDTSFAKSFFYDIAFHRRSEGVPTLHDAAVAGAEFYATLLAHFPLPEEGKTPLKTVHLKQGDDFRPFLEALLPHQRRALEDFFEHSAPSRNVRQERKLRIRGGNRMARDFAFTACIAGALTGSAYRLGGSQSTDSPPSPALVEHSGQTRSSMERKHAHSAMNTASALGALVTLITSAFAATAKYDARRTSRRASSPELGEYLRGFDCATLLEQTNGLLREICEAHQAQTHQRR